MPDRQIKGRQGAAEHGGGGDAEKGLHGQTRQEAHQQAKASQNLQGQFHQLRGVMGREFGQIDRFAIEKDVMDKPGRVSHGEDASQGCGHGQQPADGSHPAQVHGLGKKHLLGQKAVEQGRSGHGRRRHHGRYGGVRHVPPEAIDPPHVPSAGFMVDDAHGHEQGGLEGGVVDEMEDPGYGGQRRVQAEQQGDQSEVADGGIGEQPFEIMLEQGLIGSEEQGREPDPAHQEEPGVGPGQHRIQPGQDKDARLDHGGRVQVGADRGRSLHGVRQPEVEGKLGRLGEGPHQDQKQCRQVEPVRPDEFARLQDGGYPEAAGDVPQEQEPGQHGQATGAGDNQGHEGAPTGSLAMAPEADQEVGTERGQLPEDHQQQQVVGQDHPEHGPHE